MCIFPCAYFFVQDDEARAVCEETKIPTHSSLSPLGRRQSPVKRYSHPIPSPSLLVRKNGQSSACTTRPYVVLLLARRRRRRPSAPRATPPMAMVGPPVRRPRYTRGPRCRHSLRRLRRHRSRDCLFPSWSAPHGTPGIKACTHARVGIVGSTASRCKMDTAERERAHVRAALLRSAHPIAHVA